MKTNGKNEKLKEKQKKRKAKKVQEIAKQRQDLLGRGRFFFRA